MEKDPLAQSQLAGGMGVVALVAIFLPWVSIRGFMSASLYNMSQMAGFGTLFKQAPLATLGFLAVIILSGIVAYLGLAKRACGKKVALVAGGMGLLLVLIALVKGSSKGGLTDGMGGSIFDYIGIGAYVFLAAFVGLTYLGLMGKVRQPG